MSPNIILSSLLFFKYACLFDIRTVSRQLHFIWNACFNPYITCNMTILVILSTLIIAPTSYPDHPFTVWVVRVLVLLPLTRHWSQDSNQRIPIQTLRHHQVLSISKPVLDPIRQLVLDSLDSNVLEQSRICNIYKGYSINRLTLGHNGLFRWSKYIKCLGFYLILFASDVLCILFAS